MAQASFDLVEWPPVGAVVVESAGVYEELAARGYAYGPVFRGLRAVWRRGEEIFAEVALPRVAEEAAGGFGLHPALLDAVMHAEVLTAGEEGGTVVPFSWGGVSLFASGASVLRVCVRVRGAGVSSMLLADESGRAVAEVESLVSRPVEVAAAVPVGPDPAGDALFRLVWEPSGTGSGGGVTADPDTASAGSDVAGGAGWAVLGEGVSLAALEAGEAPEVVVLPAGDSLSGVGVGGGGVPVVGVELSRVLGVVQEWLAGERWLAGRLVVVTRGAVAVGEGAVSDLAGAAVWGLVRAAQAENPGRIVLADLGPGAPGAPGASDASGGPAGLAGPGGLWAVEGLGAALLCGEEQVVVRGGEVLVARLRPASGDASAGGPGAGGVLAVPRDGSGWRLGVAEAGTVEGLALLPAPDIRMPGAPDSGMAAGVADAGLVSGGVPDAAMVAGVSDVGVSDAGIPGSGVADAGVGVGVGVGVGWVRVGVRAAGVNFRDVLMTLGMYPGGGTRIGGEGAGVVLEVGVGVEDLVVGDRVFGMFDGAFGPEVVVDRRLLAVMPAGWSFEQAATVPVVFLTAWYGLVELAGVAAGQRVLVHAGAGGVGMAACQLARHLGAEVFATASPGKWPALAGLGVDSAHVASSRTLDFEGQFTRATGGQGVDVVLNSLAGEFIDASLRLLPRGGWLVEMGKTDLRDAEQVAAEHPGVAYRAFDLEEADPAWIQEVLVRLVGLFEAGVLRPLPVTAWDVRRAPEAFRFMSQARHVGKVALRMPRRLDAQGTVLVTGATGGLGAVVARHLAGHHQVRELLLTSRRGPGAPGVAELVAELAALGARARVVACDVAERQAVAGLLAGIDPQHPLTGVVHAAGVLDDGIVSSLTPGRLARVLGPKADGAWHLHELTAHMDLAAFVLFSSTSAVLDGSGQGNYAAANAFLDALAGHRHAHGLAGQSIAWGLWATGSGMSAGLSRADLARAARGGIGALSAEQGLRLLDGAAALDQPALIAVPLDRRALAARPDLPPLFHHLARPPARRTLTTTLATTLRDRLTALPAADRLPLLLDTVRTQAAAVLGHPGPDLIHPDRAFRDLGFDSLTTIELRNRIATATTLRLPATLVFDYPDPTTLAHHLHTEL
ncbi:SDR family NAD(P)-dependent oxidoreductase, partial [Streptomyces sp. NPDC048484]|uniref:SDR family NAD(P)-dependent oxidoreductase n=1 Tax=Streptomyces sp. NPDC048484 TaxID=3155146 RepID=UPI0034393123